MACLRALELAVSRLEEKLRPRPVSVCWPQDLLGLGLLIVLAAVLVPAWSEGVSIAAPEPGLSETPPDYTGQLIYLANVAGQLASFYLLPALGFALALRCGAVDLSVWAVAGLGGLVAAAAINGGMATPLAFLLAVAVGLGVGCLNGVLVAAVRLPSVAVSLLLGGALVWGMRSTWPTREIRLGADVFAGLRVLPPPPLLTGRMLLILAGYSAAMFLLLGGDMAGGAKRLGRRLGLFVALAGSGALSGFAGACWLIDHSAAPVPRLPVGDLRIPAAALLAGAALLGGKGRTMVVGVAMPVALLVATIWRQHVWNIQIQGYELQTVLLIVMTLGAHKAIGAYLGASKGRRAPQACAVLLTAGGMVVPAACAHLDTLTGLAILHAGGLVMWLAGMAVVFLCRRRQAPG